MKIFNIENGKTKMYVQLYDIGMLMRCHSINLPCSIVDRFFENVFFVTGENRFKFVEFTKSDEIEFFQNTDWILDFKVFKNSSSEEIENNISVENTDKDKLYKLMLFEKSRGAKSKPFLMQCSNLISLK